jgi:hypothetical protein
MVAPFDDELAGCQQAGESPVKLISGGGKLMVVGYDSGIRYLRTLRLCKTGALSRAARPFDRRQPKLGA